MTEAYNPQAVRRQAGIAYLAIIVFSMAGYSTLTWLLSGESSLVLARLVANHTLFALAVVASAIGFVAWIVLGILLYRLMGAAGRVSAVVMLVLVVAGTAANLVALSRLFPLFGPASSVGEAALASMVHDYNRLVLLAQIFSGLWLFPFGWLVWSTRVAPRLLAGCLVGGGIFYLLVFTTAFEPEIERTLVYRIVSIPTGILGFAGELGMCLSLLLKRPRVPRLASMA